MDQAELLRHLITVLEDLDIAYYFVGSFASAAYGEPRMTQDIDVVVDLDPSEIVRLCNSFPQPEFYVSLGAAQESVRAGKPFNVIHPTSGNKIDFMPSRRDAWGREQLARRKQVLILPDQLAFTAIPEDVILGKLVYFAEGGSEKHLRDITGMLKVSGGEINKTDIEEWADRLGVTDAWQAVLDRLAMS